MSLQINDRTLEDFNYIEWWINKAAFDDKTVIALEADVERLAEYSTSFPTGVSLGKVWKRRSRDGWLFAMYVPGRVPNSVDVWFRELLAV